jgi:hypothetical protein
MVFRNIQSIPCMHQSGTLRLKFRWDLCFITRACLSCFGDMLLRILKCTQKRTKRPSCRPNKKKPFRFATFISSLGRGSEYWECTGGHQPGRMLQGQEQTEQMKFPASFFTDSKRNERQSTTARSVLKPHHVMHAHHAFSCSTMCSTSLFHFFSRGQNFDRQTLQVCPSCFVLFSGQCSRESLATTRGWMVLFNHPPSVLEWNRLL